MVNTLYKFLHSIIFSPKVKIATAFGISVLLVFYFPVKVGATLYDPGDTLEPDCPPTESLSTCGVNSGSVSAGGTGITSYSVGDLLYASGVSALSRLAIGTNGQVLKVSGGNIVWGSGTSPNIGDTDLTLTGQRTLTLDGYSLTFNGTGGDVVINDDGTIEGSAQNLTLARIGNSTFSNLQHMQNVFHSAGWTSGGTITDAGSETVNVSAGTGLIRSSNTAVATISYMDWSATNGLSIPTNSTRYIGVEYNGGSPQVVVRTSSNWNYKTDFSIGVVVNEGGTLNIFSDKQAVGDHAANMVQRDYETMPVEPDIRNGGLVFSETGTRNIAITAGALWDRLNRYVIPTYNTSISSTFDAYYMNGSGGFNKVTGLTQWPNTKYDDESGTLATLTDGKYGVLWFYIDTNAGVSMVYGMDEYDTAGLANAAMELTGEMLPSRLRSFGRLVGKIIFQKSASSATNATALINNMQNNSGGVTNHSGLSDLDYANSGHTGFANAISGVNSNITSATGLVSITPGAALTITGGGASTWSTSSGALTIDSAAALNLGTTNATAVNLGKVGTTTTNSGSLSVLGNFITPKGTDYTTTGTQNNVNLGVGSYFHYTGISSATFTGISGGSDGRLIRILNDSSFDLTIKNLDAGSLAQNQIETPNSQDIVLSSDMMVALIYDADSLNWHLASQPTTADTIDGFAFVQSGNAFGATASLGTTDAFGLNFITGGNTRFGIASGSATLTGTGATSITTNSTLSLSSASGSALNITSGTTGAITVDSGSTGAVNIGTGSNAKTVTIGNITGATAVNINTGTGGSTLTTTNGTFSLNTGTGALNIGTDAVAKTITLGNVTGATSLNLNAGSGGGIFISSSGFTFNPFGTSTGNTTEARFAELVANGSNYVSLKSPDLLAANVTLTLPNSDGNADQVLKTDGSGVLSWSDIGACPSCVVNSSNFTVDGNGNITKINNVVTSFPASQGGSGTVLTNDGSGGLTWSSVGSGSASLDSVTAATTNATVGNGNNTINWNWTLSSNTNGLNISETTASSGTGYLERISTLATSTAKPFSLGARGTTIFDTTATGGITIGDSATLNTPITLQSGSGAINIGTDAVAKTITIGNTTGATTLNINSGSGGINFGGNVVVSGSNTFSTGTGVTTINSTLVTLAGNSSVVDMTGTGTLGLNTTTNRAITTGSGLFTAGGDMTVTGTATMSSLLSVAGNYATPKGTDHSTTGSQNDVNLGTGTLFRYTGASSATFTGITGGSDGRFIRIMNASSSTLTFANESASSTASNRIVTATGADISLAANVTVGLQYDSGASRWRVVVLPASSASVSGFAFINGGNAFGTTTNIGSTDAQALNFITGGTTRFTIASASNTLTGNGATSVTTSSGALTLDATTALNLGTSTATSVSIGKTGVTTTNNGALTSTQTLTASNGLTLTTGALNLTASSGTLTLGSTTLAGASPLVFDGATADSNKTTFAITDPTSNRTITFPDGTITINAAANISGATLASNVVNSSLTSVGTLSGGGITSGFGAISTTNNITTSANISSTGSGTITSAGTLTASNGITQTTGALTLTATSGALTLSGLSASSINTGVNDLIITSGHFNTTVTGINNTAIGVTTKSSGGFTTLTSTGATDLANAGASNVTIAATGTGNVTIGNASGTFALTSSGGLNVTTGGVLTGVASIDTITYSATAIGFAGTGSITSGSATNLSFTSGTTGSITLDSGSTGAVNIGTNSNAKTITIGNTTGATALNLNSGSGGITLGGQLITASSGIEFTESDTNPTCASGNYSVYADTSEGKLKKCQNGIASDLNAIPDVNSFTDTTTETVADNDTTNYWDGTAPNITPKSTTSEILVMMTANIASTSNTDTQTTFQIMRHTSAITCQSVGTAVGGQIGTFQGFATAGGASISTVFVDTPATTSNIQYTLCSDADSEAAVGTMSRIDFTLFEINNAADLAEIYSTNDNTISMGDVVSLDSSLIAGVKKSSGVGDKNVVGIVSTKPAMVIGGTNNEGVSVVPVALSGRVPVKVVTENGSVYAGDYLTPSSVSGVAMKFTGIGPIIGQAMSAYEGEGVGMVTVFVKNFDLGNIAELSVLLGDVSPLADTDSMDNGLSKLINDIQTEDIRNPLEVFTTRINESKKILVDFVSARVTAIRGYFDEIFTKKIHTEQICLKKSNGTEVCMTGDQMDVLLQNTDTSASAYVESVQSKPDQASNPEVVLEEQTTKDEGENIPPLEESTSDELVSDTSSVEPIAPIEVSETVLP